jgi:hypothetical protein
MDSIKMAKLLVVLNFTIYSDSALKLWYWCCNFCSFASYHDSPLFHPSLLLLVRGIWDYLFNKPEITKDVLETFKEKFGNAKVLFFLRKKN